MKLRLFFIFTAMLLLLGCGGHGGRSDKPIASGDGLGREWSGAPGQVRIGVDNSLTREVEVHVDMPRAHYEIIVGPGRQRHIIVPAGSFKFSAYYPDGKSLGNNYIHYDDQNGAKGLLFDIDRP